MTQQMVIKASGLHTNQMKIWNDPSRFKVIAAGRRFGKTRLGVAQCITRALQGKRCWWVSPTYRTYGEVAWRSLKAYSQTIPGVKISEVHTSIDFPCGGSVVLRSASEPDTLRGEGLDYIFMDEASLVKEQAWVECLRPALVDKHGDAAFGFTPKGKNWIYRLFKKHSDESPTKSPNWHSFHYTSYDNPFLDPEELEEAKTQMPERLFKQEHMAEFLDDAGGVLRKVVEAATAVEQREPIFGHIYSIGMDLAKYNDFTVIIVLDETTGSEAFIDRFNQIDYTIQLGRLKAIHDRFKPKMITIEQNSIGDPFIEQVEKEGMKVQPFKTTGDSKKNIIDALALAFERSQLRIIADPIHIDELQAYEATRTKEGTLKYGAPDGMHDDSVMALAIAWSGARAPVGSCIIASDMVQLPTKVTDEDWKSIEGQKKLGNELKEAMMREYWKDEDDN